MTAPALGPDDQPGAYQLTFPNIDEFYTCDWSRYISGEADYGVHWRLSGATFPRWRVSYVRLTGEVYATELIDRSRARVVILGIVPADEVPPGDEYRATYYQALDALISGYADYDQTHGFSLEWLASRLAHTLPANREAADLPCALQRRCPAGFTPAMQTPCAAMGTCMRPERRPHP